MATLPFIDRLADHVVDHAMSMLDAFDRSARLVHDLDHHRGLPAEKGAIF